jgi:hypothetical protein
MSLLTRKTAILAKLEVTYGTDPVPTAAANALLVRNVSLKPTGETIKRDFVRDSLSPLTFLRGIKEVELSFETELKGSGVRGSLPAWGWEGVLLQACGMTETVTAATSIAYNPTSDTPESCTIYVYRDGLFHKVTGCRGNFKLTCEVGKFPMIAWTFKGIFNSVVDAAVAAQTFSTVTPVTCLNTVLSVDGYGPCVEKIEIDLNNSLTARKCMSAASGITEWMITGREPQGSFDPEAVLEADEDFWNKWETADDFALTLGPIGTVSGNIVTITAPKMQYKDLTYGDRNGILTYDTPFGLAGNAGDDELIITIT